MLSLSKEPDPDRVEPYKLLQYELNKEREEKQISNMEQN